MLTVEEIVAKMRENYDPVVRSLPVELQEEFSTRVLPLKELEDLASFIATTTEFEGSASIGLTLRKINRKVAVISFNKKLISAAIRPDDVYSRLLKGCFEID